MLSRGVEGQTGKQNSTTQHNDSLPAESLSQDLSAADGGVPVAADDL